MLKLKRGDKNFYINLNMIEYTEPRQNADMQPELAIHFYSGKTMHLEDEDNIRLVQQALDRRVLDEETRLIRKRA